MARRTKVALLAGIAALGLVPAGLALAPALTEEPVLTGPRNESRPAIVRTNGADVLVWTETRPGHLDRWDVYLRRGSKAKIKLNAKGMGFSGDISPPWVVYEQIVAGKADIRVYRLDKRKRVATPKGINTKQWEWYPRISGKWILFARDSLSAPVTRVVLFNRKTRAQRVLAIIRNAKFSLVPGQISGNWVTWYKCTPVCDSYLYNIGARTTTKLAKPTGPGNVNVWSPAVTRSGVVYAGQGPDDCGDSVQLVRYRGPGDAATGTALYDFPDQKDLNGAYARTNGDGSVDLYYARISCGSTQRSDIYRVTDPAPPSP